MTTPCTLTRDARAPRIGCALRIAACLASAAFASNAAATPVTYYFSGAVTEYSYTGSSFNPAAGDAISGSFTYDANYQGQYLGGPWPRAAAILDWTLSVGSEAYAMSLFSPFVQIPSATSDRFTFSDEQPGNTAGAAFFDQGIFEFLFSSNAATLPVEDFLGGAYSFGGGSQNPGDFFRGSIDSLTTIPEPGTLALFGIGLLALLRQTRGGCRASA